MKQAKVLSSEELTEGDLVVIHTILTSPAYLMGIAETDIGDFRDTARKFIKPESWKTFEGGKKAEKAMELAKKSLVEKKARVERYRLEDQKQATDALNAIRTLPK